MGKEYYDVSYKTYSLMTESSRYFSEVNKIIVCMCRLPFTVGHIL